MIALPPPSVAVAHQVVHAALDSTAQVLDGHLVIGACARHGEQSRVCIAAVRGGGQLRLRVIVTTSAPGAWTVRARPL
jgi:hypothetical protein